MRKWIVLLCALAACGGEESTQTEQKETKAPRHPEWRMSEDPGTAYSVADAKEELPTEEVVVVGRIRKMVKGFAVFQITDDKLDYCGEVNETDTCPTPWDYCCDPQDMVNDLTLAVQFEDESGKPLRADLFGDLRLCDLVVVKGKVTKDDQGNVVVHAKQFFRRERPDLPDYVRFP